jgi:hypothetical protein
VLPPLRGKTVTDLTAPGRALVTGDGPYAAVYALETAVNIASPAIVTNRGYDVLMNAVYSRELYLLGVEVP